MQGATAGLPDVISGAFRQQKETDGRREASQFKSQQAKPIAQPTPVLVR